MPHTNESVEQRKRTLTNIHSDNAVPVFGGHDERVAYIERLEAAGWVLYMDTGTGLYYLHDEWPNHAMWVGWNFDGMWYVERISVNREEV